MYSTSNPRPKGYEKKSIALKKNWIGKRQKRKEDSRIIRGRAQYVDDIQLPGMVYCKILRSPYAHAKIRNIDATRAKALEGVFYILTGDEAMHSAKSWSDSWVFPGSKNVNERCLAVDKVRYVGEPIAAVAAIDRYVAEDAANSIDVDYEPLPVVVDVMDAMNDNTSTLIHDEWGTNVQAVVRSQAGDIEKAFKESDIIVEDRFETQRATGAPIETCGTVASYDSNTNSLTVWSSTQAPFRLRTVLAKCLDLVESNIRCIAPDIGGGFGIKDSIFPHELIVPILSMKLGLPVKFYEDRQEHLIATHHGYHHIYEVKVGAKKDGTILGWQERIIQDGGAYPTYGLATLAQPYAMQPGVYKYRNIQFESIGVCTNKAALGAYRGLSDPQMSFVREVMIDKLAKRLGLDRREIRLKNMVKTNELPYTLSTGAVLDSGSFEESFRKVLNMLDYDEIKKKKEPNVGVGFAIGIHYSGCRGTPRDEAGGADYEGAFVRVEPTGTITVLASNIPQGQGHETSLAQIAAEEFGVDIGKVNLIHGDTDKCPQGNGTMASRCIAITGSAIVFASREVKRKMTKIAANSLEAREDDLEFGAEKIVVKGMPSIFMDFLEIANIAWSANGKLPEGVTPGLEAVYTYSPPNNGVFDENGIGNLSVAYTNAADGAVVKVDPETGEYKILKYVIAHDCGVAINPMIIEGQIQGGVCQGLGTAAYEDLSYDENGQPLATLLADYACPTAAEMPMLTEENIATFESPSPVTPTGAKGVGEISMIHPPAVLANAITDALGIEAVTELPLTSERIYRLIKKFGVRPFRSSEG